MFYLVKSFSPKKDPPDLPDCNQILLPSLFVASIYSAVSGLLFKSGSFFLVFKEETFAITKVTRPGLTYTSTYVHRKSGLKA